MPLDVLSLQSFYGSPLGGVARRLIGRVIRERWTSSAGLSIAAVGYGPPYLERFRDGARRCLALMPAEQGVVVWPEAGRCAAALVDAQMLPLPDGSMDRLLLAHALEAADRPDALLEEIMAHHRAGGPNDRDRSLPPGRLGAHGQHTLWTRLALFEIAAARLAPAGGLLADLLGRGASRAPDRRKPFMMRSATTIERVGGAVGLPFAGVHIVEAIKQVHRPVGVRTVARTRLPPLKSALAPSARRERHSE